MEDTKKTIQSVGMWGGTIALLPAIDALLSFFNIVPDGLLTQNLKEVASGLGGLLAIWGRLRASKKIDGLF